MDSYYILTYSFIGGIITDKLFPSISWLIVAAPFSYEYFSQHSDIDYEVILKQLSNISNFIK